MIGALLPRLIAGAPSSLQPGCLTALTSLLPFQQLQCIQQARGPASQPGAAQPVCTAAPAPARAQQGGLAGLAGLASSLGLQSRGLAGGSKAEEFDLISVEVGLARIDGYDETGFIVNDFQVEGPIMCYGDLVTLWRAPRFADLSMDSLALLDLIKPVPALLVVGCGRSIRPLPAGLLAALRERGITVEALDTVNAVATFNILNQEGRKVVGAMLPLAAP